MTWTLIFVYTMQAAGPVPGFTSLEACEDAGLASRATYARYFDRDEDAARIYKKFWVCVPMGKGPVSPQLHTIPR